MPIITNLFQKQAPNTKVIPVSLLKLKKGFGIIGDINASGISPRQVLITRAEELDSFNAKPGNLSENIVVKGLDRNHFVPGNVIQLQNVVIRWTMYCEPCYKIKPFVSDYKKIQKYRGLLGVVLESGEITLDASLKILDKKYEPLPENNLENFITALNKVPAGKLVTYKDLAKIMGLSPGFIRAIPGYIKKTLNTDTPVHRILNSKGMLLNNYITDQEERLCKEGHQIRDGSVVDFSKYIIDEPLFLG